MTVFQEQRLPMERATFLVIFVVFMCLSVDAGVWRNKRGTLVDIFHSQALLGSSTIKPKIEKQAFISSYASSSSGYSFLNFPSSFSILPLSPVINNPQGAYASHIDPIYDPQSNNDIAASAALQKRFYFATIPHKDLVLKHETRRERNGLGRHLLESIRPFHPFYVSY